MEERGRCREGKGRVREGGIESCRENQKGIYQSNGDMRGKVGREVR